MPTGVWQHLAVVNDGKRSIIYINGSKIARNPTRPAQGIATLGRPFVIGATSFDLGYGQGFYGWIGDVRITSRALKPAHFLPGATSADLAAPPMIGGWTARPGVSRCWWPGPSSWRSSTRR